LWLFQQKIFGNLLFWQSAVLTGCCVKQALKKVLL